MTIGTSFLVFSQIELTAIAASPAAVVTAAMVKSIYGMCAFSKLSITDLAKTSAVAASVAANSNGSHSFFNDRFEPFFHA